MIKEQLIKLVENKVNEIKITKNKSKKKRLSKELQYIYKNIMKFA